MSCPTLLRSKIAARSIQELKHALYFRHRAARVFGFATQCLLCGALVVKQKRSRYFRTRLLFAAQQYVCVEKRGKKYCTHWG